MTEESNNEGDKARVLNLPALEMATFDPTLEHAVAIVCSYLKGAAGSARIDQLGDLIDAAVAGVAKHNRPDPILLEPKAIERVEPRIPIKDTITPDYLVSLEDGKKYRSLKRHLTKFGLTPEQYRAKYGLPADYPMVSPNLRENRVEIAKKFGLGKRTSAAASG